MCVCVCLCLLFVSVDESSTQLPWRRRGTLDFLFYCKGRPGVILGSPKNNVFIERDSLSIDLYAPSLTVEVTLHSCLVPPLTLIGLELHSAAQMGIDM